MDFTQILRTVAPWIATALGGPLGGMAVEAAANALGLTDKTSDGLKAALSGATQADLLALQKADKEFQVTMKLLGIKEIAELETIAAGDRDSARRMQIAKPSLVPAMLSTIITLGFLGLLTGMMTGYLKADDNQAMLIMLGALGVAFGQVMNFWMGSTRDSSRKTELLAQAPAIK